ERGAAFAGVAQDVPTRGEVAGEEEDQQDADDFDGLESEEVDLGVARAWAVAERDQQRGEDEAGEQRNVAELAEVALVVEHAGGGEDQAADGDAFGEIDEEELVADGVAEADHEDQADAGEKDDGGEERLVAFEAAQAPPEVDAEEGEEEDGAPKEEGAAELL